MSGYSYYCLECGKKLDQESVLFNVNALLGISDNTDFPEWNLRVTQEELSDLYDSGTDSVRQGGGADYNDYKDIVFEYKKTWEILGSAHNIKLAPEEIILLKDQDIKTFKAYLRFLAGEKPEDPKPEDKKADSGEATHQERLILAGQGPEDPKPEDKNADLVEAVYRERFKAFLPLYAKIALNQPKETRQSVLSTILSSVFEKFVVNDDNYTTIQVTFRLEYTKDIRDRDVATGYCIRTDSVTNTTITKQNARVCPRCGKEIFDEAGTAVHKAVTFFGAKGSSKTCTIVSLVQYALHAMHDAPSSNSGMNDPELTWENFTGARILSERAPNRAVWASAHPIREITNVPHLVQPNEHLMLDLEKFTYGIYPDRTATQETAKEKAIVGSDAYKATLLLESRARKMILTFTDLPGELCEPEKRKIDVDRLIKDYSIAFNCDAIVFCIDAKDNDDPTRINNICYCADQFQKRYALLRGGCLAPICIAVTKDKTIEGELPANRQYSGGGRISKRLMVPEHEQRAFNNYDSITKRFREEGTLKRTYQIGMRCSPYGFEKTDALIQAWKEKVKQLQDKDLPTTAEQSLLKIDDIIKEGNFSLKLSPKNIHLLMQWILRVTGCIPTVDNKTLKLPQNRSLAPGNGKKGLDVDEAKIRCVLFANPNKYDIELADNDKGLSLWGARFNIWADYTIEHKQIMDKQKNHRTGSR